VSPGAARAPTRRLFFALWPDTAARRALTAASAAAVSASGGRPVPPQNLHATLVFLGAVPAARSAELAALARVAAAAWPPRAGPLLLRFTRLAHWRAPQVLCALTARGDDAPARALAQALQAALVAAGFRPDLKPFRAHVTVARNVARAPRATRFPAVTWKCATVALIESRSAPGGSVYSVLESAPLGKREKFAKER
jgi:RNA 2',3'-cyclic 3'-phosphodiesterase